MFGWVQLRKLYSDRHFSSMIGLTIWSFEEHSHNVGTQIFLLEVPMPTSPATIVSLPMDASSAKLMDVLPTSSQVCWFKPGQHIIVSVPNSEIVRHWAPIHVAEVWWETLCRACSIPGSRAKSIQIVLCSRQCSWVIEDKAFFAHASTRFFKSRSTKFKEEVLV